MKSYKRGYEVTPLSYNRGVTTHNHILVYRTKSVFLFCWPKKSPSRQNLYKSENNIIIKYIVI